MSRSTPKSSVLFWEHRRAQAFPVAQAIGASIDQIGLNDTVLPAEIKAILSRDIGAKKEAHVEVSCVVKRPRNAISGQHGLGDGAGTNSAPSQSTRSRQRNCCEY